MKALRWILFSLLAFGLGTGVALAVHPPSIGIPVATASGLSDDLAKIQEYAADGKCNAVRGRLQGAAAKIDRLPARTATATVDELTTSLARVRNEALSTCQSVVAERAAEAQRKREAQEALEAATPETTPSEEVEPSTPATTPEPTLDPGTGETTPVQPDGGDDLGEDGTTGGVTIPGEEAIRQRVEKERRRLEKQAEKIRKAWEQ